MNGFPLALVRDTPTRRHGIACPNALRAASFAAKKPARRSAHIALAHRVAASLLPCTPYVRSARELRLVEVGSVRPQRDRSRCRRSCGPIRGAETHICCTGSADANSPIRQTSGSVGHIGIVPINAMDATFLERLALCLEERFLFQCEVERRCACPAHDAQQRAQAAVPEHAGGEGRRDPARRRPAPCRHRLRPLQDVAPVHLRRRERRAAVAVVSLHRLRSDFYGEGRREPALPAHAEGSGSRPRARTRAQTLLQRALRDVFLEFDLRHRQQALALLRDLRESALAPGSP
jgi:hypothetical protein